MNKLFTSLCLFQIVCWASAQVGINTENPKATFHINPSSLKPTDPEGAILPNLTREQLISKDTSYTTNQVGAIVYVTDLSGTLTPITSNITSAGYYYFDGTAWMPLSSSSSSLSQGSWNKIGTYDLSTTNTDDIYIKGKAVVGGDAIATVNTNQEAVLTVTGGDASVNGITLGKGASAGTNNVVFGINSLKVNTTGTNNTAIGASALQANTTGQYNVAAGTNSLIKNAGGNNNTAIGYNSLASNTSGGSNVAIGYATLNYNTTGNYNVAIGTSSNVGSSSSTAISNGVSIGNSSAVIGGSGVAVGDSSGVSGTNGVAIGSGAKATGEISTAVGSNATASGIYAITMGYGAQASGLNAIAMGFGAQAIGSNSLAFGYGASNSIANSIVLGNASITSIRAQVQSITALSDGRVKKDVQSNVPGLSFITKLRPVTYHLDINAQAEITGTSYDPLAQKQNDQLLQSGFIAQEVEKAAKETGYDFNGVYTPKNDKDTYGLNYSTFVVPLVKAVQEQQDQLKKQQEKINTLETLIKELLKKQS